MGIQEIIAFTIVGLAAVYIARLFISKSTPNKNQIRSVLVAKQRRYSL
jgi:uncharacterized membrane protein YuzA (DUF378 family)